VKASFVISGSGPEHLRDVGDAEVGFIGRSNVGKSSLLNAIMGTHALVRVSRTPGRTRLMNQFLWQDQIALVDLPGYGFAKAGRKDLADMQAVLRAYLGSHRASAMVLLVDIRREDVSPLDQEVMRIVLETSTPLLVICTKADQVPKNRLLHYVRKIEQSLDIAPGCSLAVSSQSGLGVVELRRRLLEVRKWT
jgi:GTP-binding protein